MLFIAFLLALQQTAAPPPAKRVPPSSLNVEVRVTDRSGTPLADVLVSADGPSRREGTTDARGLATLQTIAPGTYRIRAEADHFIALEKEATLRAATGSLQFALSRAPEVEVPVSAPAPPPPPPPPTPVLPLGSPGDPRVVSIPDLAEKSLGKREDVTVVPIACSGTGNVRLLLVKESLPLGSHQQESQTLYMVSGQATLTIDKVDQPLAAGWVGVVPRAVPYALTKKGKNPAVLLSVTSGQPCGSPNAAEP